jgi:hypothetical protein
VSDKQLNVQVGSVISLSRLQRRSRKGGAGCVCRWQHCSCGVITLCGSARERVFSSDAARSLFWPPSSGLVGVTLGWITLRFESPSLLQWQRHVWVRLARPQAAFGARLQPAVPSAGQRSSELACDVRLRRPLGLHPGRGYFPYLCLGNYCRLGISPFLG